MKAKLGIYDIVEEIGKGGMATVYRARQQSVDRDVAIKVILKRIAGDPAAVQRFQREAKLIARLEHPHILPVYDFDGSHEPPYIVMRYLDGGTLKDVITQGLLPHNEVVYLMHQICSALGFLHPAGDAQGLSDFNHWVQYTRDNSSMSEAEIQAEIEADKALDVDAIVDALLQELA